MRVDDLKPAPGSSRAKRRVGRGIGGHGGKTAGRGTKGQRARNTVARGFEGGQMPLKQRVPKLKGFNNPFRIEYQGVNLDTLEAVAAQYELSRGHAGHPPRATACPTRAPSSRCSAGARSPAPCGSQAHGFSKAAEAAITAAGGTVDVLPLPYRTGRPPVKGNQFTNR